MEALKLNSPLVNSEWLEKHLTAPNLITLDASLPKAGMGEDTLSTTVIPGARFMDLKNRWSQKEARFPNTMLDEKSFEREAQLLGINQNSALVVYDQHGIYSSARAWYMLRAMGHKNVAVLDGGLPAWKNSGFPLEKKTSYKGGKGNFEAKLDSDYFLTSEQVMKLLEDDTKIILDARANDRFRGIAPEPRQGLRSGHIPGSKSLPYSSLQQEGAMLDAEALNDLLSPVMDPKQSLVFSCGSGITACVLALGAELTGRSGFSVYDGSWTEWGSLHELPIEKEG